MAAAWGPLWPFGVEVAADDWPATLALLHHDARARLDMTDPPAELRWPLPRDSLAAQVIADAIEVDGQQSHRPRAGWMARVVDRWRLIEPLALVWGVRLRAGAAAATTGLALVVDGACVTEITAAGCRVGDAQMGDLPTVHLTSVVLVPLLFGYRTVVWAARQPGQQSPPMAMPMVEALFPPAPPYVPPTDGC